MTYLRIPTSKPVGRESQITYLRSHCRYYTMNSWNRSTSYAHIIKIACLLDLNQEDQDRCYEGLQCPEAFDDFNDVLDLFSIDNPEWSICINGRSGGYLVLYQQNGRAVYPGRPTDQDEHFEDWDDEDIGSRVDLIMAFDEACEMAVASYVDFCRSHRFEL
jgi:hypothetical protein